jgi:hypothetical protein
MASASDAQVSEWQASNRMDHQIAAVVAIWARGKERGTSLPSNVLGTGNGPYYVA